MNDLLRKAQELNRPAGDFAIFGSGPLLVRGIIDHVGDIDILCRGDAWLITLGRSWGYGDFDVDELIDSAEEINGLPSTRVIM